MDMSQIAESKKVATELVKLCREGKFQDAVKKLYAKDVLSVEGMSMPGQARETKGLEAVLARGEWWEANHEVHSCKVSDPFCSVEKFACQFDLDVTFKPEKKRMQMSEMAIYTIKAGKISQCEFLFVCPG
jgi:hypothetical protein